MGGMYIVHWNARWDVDADPRIVGENRMPRISSNGIIFYHTNYQPVYLIVPQTANKWGLPPISRHRDYWKKLRATHAATLEKIV